VRFILKISPPQQTQPGPQSAYWNESIENLFAELHSSESGLSTNQAQERLEQVGPNRLQEKAKLTILGAFLNQFKSPILLILVFATLVSAFLKDWADSIIILVIVLGSAILSFVQEYGANQASEKLQSKLTIQADVLRDGQVGSLPIENLVPGDILMLSAGSLIPADGVVLEAKDFFVNQAVLTGETFPVEKIPGITPVQASLAERINVVYMGTNVRSGSSRVVVVLTGTRTTFGQIAHRMTLKPPETEFERGIRRLGFLLTEIMLFLVLGIFAFNVISHKPVLDSLLFSIALAVGLTPQLLPAIISINLSRGSQKMAQQGVIVRRLEAIENFGSMDVLCTDKTGTLTRGIVKLDGTLDALGKPSESVYRLAFLNAHFQSGLSNPLDEAILAGKTPDINETSKVDEIPYDFVRKRMSVVVADNGKQVMIVKGALENVLEVCNQAQIGESIDQLNESLRKEIHHRFEEWSEQGYRVLGLASRAVNSEVHTFERKDEQNLVFQGFLLFLDPPKEKVGETIQQLEKLGVKLKIITGDNRLVAGHIAQMVGLEMTGLLTGNDLDDLRDEALWHAAENTTIFAEVDPNQKERIILALKKTGHVVGYMGDGINDAPSLHSADVGVSVDNAVDVAKEAADFVLLKQDLSVLLQGIIEGRRTFANSLKYVFMATSANFGNMFSVAGASLFLPFLPMLPKQILLINFLTDLPEMTIAGDNVDPLYINRPHRWDVNFIRRFMLVFGPLSSIFDFFTFGLLLWVFKAGQEVFHTGWFVESVLSACLVVFALRTRLPLFRSQPSRAMLAVTVIVGLTALALPYSPLAGLMGFEPLPLGYLVAITAIVLFYILLAEMTKRWFYRRFGALQ
jgi:P-type Mg2+ transporter